ncbi:hypothetical protein KY321_04085, partial [Candidatus Woesearchaeota archaeon]|nr:hypothetical protein [Candidatus Woesearchaeota archaeon]
KTNGVPCDGATCTNINCVGNTLTFTAAHFDGFAGEGDEPGAIPEFSFWAVFLVMVSTGIATFFITKKE